MVGLVDMVNRTPDNSIYQADKNWWGYTKIRAMHPKIRPNQVFVEFYDFKIYFNYGQSA